MLGWPTQQIQSDRFVAATAVALHINGVALLKGKYTLIAQEGQLPSVNATGNPILASGGTGDVLTGVVGALLARGCTARDAARLAAWVHGAAADKLALERSQGWTASDIARAIPDAVESLIRG